MRSAPDVLVDNIGYGRTLGIPIITLIALAAVLVGGIMLHKTRFGRYTYAIGSNETSARRVGINVDRKLIQIYALSGFLAGLAGPEAPGGARRLFWADEGGAGRPALAAFAEAGPAPAAVLIGPEGGFDDAERAALRGLAGTVAIGLGPRILRADTAAVAALALWQAAAGDWAAEESPAGTKT